MGRGVSSGGGQSSLGYLFGSGEAPKPTGNTSEAPKVQAEVAKPTAAAPPAAAPSAIAPSASPPSGDAGKQIPAGVPGNKANNYFRADGQNCGNFLTDRPTTKVHAAPGGGSSLNYLFGGDGK
ncbi:hypothetical protein Patl1_18921 [Pistacia atlantica]|uniref:Uncharacterized protein n=1 Tax=Pistacia atlantica TaxID=434234 RepID=A0ACC1C279_9ROSI|nr:hypothetical protein Patl1_18921 [Pistacia atlantica]